MKRLTAAWVKKAEADFVAAGKLARQSIPLHDQVCFLSQQAAEKYLKALMVELGKAVPRTHNLIALLPLLSPFHSELRSLRRGLDSLTRFAVDTRYPGFRARRRQADAAHRWAGQVRTDVRAILGLHPRHSRPKKPP